ncbi:uncharacterized protein LOC133815133 [Humulus lupulus]|uniref:uncharacterized protein LOC133815133 n=1 Tax=Humulus lupulus TaxID=3486 RepID=UPI002B40D7DB|nr:uncharacterized protein LOC133815133 [Humulus lupulus]
MNKLNHGLMQLMKKLQTFDSIMGGPSKGGEKKNTVAVVDSAKDEANQASSSKAGDKRKDGQNKTPAPTATFPYTRRLGIFRGRRSFDHAGPSPDTTPEANDDTGGQLFFSSSLCAAKPSSSLRETLDFSRVRSEHDVALLEDARQANKSGEKMNREHYGDLRRKIGGTYKDFFKSYVEDILYIYMDGKYVEEGWVDKTCKVCKKDRRGEARQVDKLGRYVHVACLEKSKSGNFSPGKLLYSTF